MRSVPAEYKAYGLDMTGYDEIAEAVTKAALSKSERIILNVSSGGGMTDGIDVAIDAIRAAKSVKPVHAYADGLVASAAYWLASQASNVFATRLTEVGGIGVYSVMYDTSKAMKDRGIEAVVARSGSVKGAGIYGDAITEEMRAVEQETVDAIAGKFFADVSANRIELDKEATTSGRPGLQKRPKNLI
jgi:Periplasmic serine proteases (ClpP class)